MLTLAVAFGAVKKKQLSMEFALEFLVADRHQILFADFQQSAEGQLGSSTCRIDPRGDLA